MEKLSMCRICLAQDVRMHTIVNTHLEDMYEKLSDKMFMTKDIRPVQACYICCARLQNCYLLKMSCVQSEDLFTQMLSGDMMTETMLLQMPVTKTLSVTPVMHLTTGPPIHKHIPNIKLEPPEVTDDVEIKKEIFEDDREVSPGETELLEQNVKEKVTEKNDVPLIYLKIEPVDIETDAPDLEEAELQFLEEIPTSKPIKSKNIKNNKKTKIENGTQKFKNKRDHKLKENYQQCDLCKKKINNIFDFAKHDCIKIKFTCDLCNKEFSSISGLGVHKRIHTGTKPYTCTICNRSFTDKSTLCRHKLVHTDEKPFKCGTCNKGFKRKSHLSTHILVHTNERPYQCGECKKSFSQKGHLREHTKIHLGSRRYVCDVCKNNFSDRSCMVRHMRRMHSL